mmetsp:Transcript_74952/g.223335  ORF Transcript_74952/g.223335 Transcript_74952/m.223335 type:complete len:241 (+) Transcript_74952:350-1072(+)
MAPPGRTASTTKHGSPESPWTSRPSGMLSARLSVRLNEGAGDGLPAETGIASMPDGAAAGGGSDSAAPAGSEPVPPLPAPAAVASTTSALAASWVAAPAWASEDATGNQGIWGNSGAPAIWGMESSSSAADDRSGEAAGVWKSSMSPRRATELGLGIPAAGAAAGTEGEAGAATCGSAADSAHGGVATCGGCGKNAELGCTYDGGGPKAIVRCFMSASSPLRSAAFSRSRLLYDSAQAAS